MSGHLVLLMNLHLGYIDDTDNLIELQRIFYVETNKI